MADLRSLRRRTPRLRMLATAGLLSAAVAVAAWATGALGAIEDASLAQRFGARAPAPPSDLVIVAVDDATFSDLGVQWPFPRTLFGRAADRLHRAGVRDIVYDVQFTEPTIPRQDYALYRAIGRDGGAVMATTESDERGRTRVLGGDGNLRRIGAVAAASNFPDDADGGVIRHFTSRIDRLETIAVAEARRRGRPVDAGRFPPGGAYIDYRGPAGTIPTVSFSDLLRGRVDPALLRGRIAVVGVTAPSLHDEHPTPAGRSTMAGPEVQANAIWTLLHGLPLAAAPGWLDVAAIILVTLLVPLLALRVRPVIAALAAPAAGVAYVALAQLAFESGLVVTVAAPLLGLALATVATVVVSHLMETVERQRVADVNDLLEAEVQARTSDLRATELEIVQRLGRALDSHDEETGDHIQRIGALCRRLALAAGLTPEHAELLERASAMHDIGKIAIPERILTKPGPLDPEERAAMQRHTTAGADLLAGSPSRLVRLAEEIARTHHERWDGSGYPRGLAGDAIPIEGRICAICDVFDALVSERPYKRAWPVEQALAEIAAGSGSHFDPRLVEHFLALRLEREDPLGGTLVTLATPQAEPARVSPRAARA